MNQPTSPSTSPASAGSRRLVGFAATLGVVLFVVGTPIVLTAVGSGPASVADWSGSWDMLDSPDDGTLALKVLALVAWVAWLIMTISLLIETASRVRGVQTPRLPGFGVPQVAAGRVIAAASLLFITLPVATQSLATPHAHATENHLAATSAPAPSVPPTSEEPVAAPAPEPDATATAAPSAKEQAPATVDYTVKRGDSLWKIADEHLADGRRFVEIVALNHDVLHGKPDFITPGTVLRLPAQAETDHESHTPPTDEAYTVKAGDTLSQIADEQLGEPGRYPEIFDASRDTLQPDNARLADPDLIRPGWRLTIPEPTPRQPPRVDQPEPEPLPGPGKTPVRPIDPPIVEPTGEPARQSPQSEPIDRDDEEDQMAPAWLLPGLAGTGAALSGVLLLALRQHRRTQTRFRRPGHIIATAPPELLSVQKTAHHAGTPMVSQVERLDAALRWLAASVDDLPALVGVELSAETVVLHLAGDVELPAPWEGGKSTWSLACDIDVPNTVDSGMEDQLAPYPLLVTIGRDTTEHLWLLNFEHFGVVTVTGDPESAEAFGRYVAAELALNPWSASVDIDTLGLAAELTTLAPLRLHHHEPSDLEFLDNLAHDLDTGLGFPSAGPEQFHVVVSVDTAGGGPAAMRKVVKIITSGPGKSGTAVVTVNGAPAPGDVVLELTTDGRIVANSIGLDVTAVGLTTAEAAACAAIVDITRDADNVPIPVDDTTTQGWQGVTDAAGALRKEHHDARPEGPAGEGSLLPLAAMQYADAAPTTVEDVETLAPVVTSEAKARVEQADPDLDADLAAWFDTDCPLPRLTLLGPVNARTHGNARAAIKRKPYYVELLAFLALLPHGASTQEIVDAFSITRNRARVDLTALRSWLGRNPRTGRDHLPDARTTEAAAQRGTAAYQVEDVLTDVDLFRRLRARGQARGAAGMDDLCTALRLVTGEPFSGLRDAGWAWLLDGDRIDHVMASAIVDVTHLVTTHALTAGDLELAQFAAETSCTAAPYDDIGRLDLVQVASLMGQTGDAQRRLVDDVFNRSDDDLGPVDLPERTARIVRQRGWNRRQRTTK